MMDTDVVIGSIAIVVSLGFITYLVLWSRRVINRIARKGLRSARDITRELNDGG